MECFIVRQSITGLKVFLPPNAVLIIAAQNCNLISFQSSEAQNALVVYHPYFTAESCFYGKEEL